MWLLHVFIWYQSPFFRPLTLRQLKALDIDYGLQFHRKCFQDPSQFTVVIVGALDIATALPMITKYLAGIPRPPEGIAPFPSRMDAVTPIVINPPNKVGPFSKS